MPREIMPLGYRKLLQEELNGDTALEMVQTANEGLLQRLELLERDSCCSNRGPAFTCKGMQVDLLQPDQPVHRVADYNAERLWNPPRRNRC